MSQTDKDLRRAMALANPKGIAVNKARKPATKQTSKVCFTCLNSFLSTPSGNRKYCSDFCFKRSGDRGGIRKGSGRGKSGLYQNIWFSSTYELAYFLWCKHHNLDIKRSDRIYNYEYQGSKHKYHPDFEVNGEIVEIKNYRSELTDIKTASVTDIPIKVLYGDDLKNVFEEVKLITGLNIKDLHQLYESDRRESNPH